MSVRLSPDEAWDVLERSHTGILTTLCADGTPIALPVWFVTLERRVYVATPSRAKKVGRLRRDRRVSFLVESGLKWAELRAVHLTGTASIVSEPALLARVRARLDAKYAAFRTARSAMPEATRRHYAGEQVVIDITPDERMLTWDNARLRLAD